MDLKLKKKNKLILSFFIPRTKNDVDCSLESNSSGGGGRSNGGGGNSKSAKAGLNRFGLPLVPRNDDKMDMLASFLPKH